MNKQVFSDIRQSSVGGIEELVGTCVVLGPNPFAFHHSPERFGNVQVRGIRREEEKEKSPSLPDGSYLPHLFVPMHSCVIKYYKSVLADSEGEIIKESDDPVCCHLLHRGKSLIVIISGNHPEDVQPCNPLGGDEHFFSGQLPSVGNIALRTDMALISEEELYAPLFCLLFKFLQLLQLILVELRRGDSPWAFPYTLISCANADKKRLKVISLASLPVAASQAALALLTLCRSCSMARDTISSSEESMIGLRPRPGRVSRPLIPSDSKRRTHERTLIPVISVCSPALSAERPSAFRSTARQRIRKQCFSPCRKPCSNSRRSLSVRDNCFGFPILPTPIYNRTQKAEIYFV